MKHLRLFTATLLLLIGLGSATLLPVTALAATPQSAVCSALGSNGNCSSTPSGGVNINNVITAAIEIISAIAGVAAVIMIIVSGFRMITANGDSNAISSARNTLMYALIGLVIVALSQGIVYFVLHHVLFGK